jgi:hypothetical protein
MMPDLSSLLGPPDPESAQARTMAAYQKAVREQQEDERRMVTGRWAGLYCTCAFLRTPEKLPAQAGCIVHASWLLTPDGRVL